MSVAPAQPIKGEPADASSASPQDAMDAMDDAQDIPQGTPPPPKRKGGRKPIYATSEERKQRNRQAQAAFRERRTEYIKQLETTLKQNEDTVQNLRRSHRSATEECHLLRYRNSLLERILIEKGFDVQVEMQMRGASPTTARPQGPQHSSPASPSAPIAQQAIMNRHQQAMRQPAGAAPKLEQAFDASSMQSLRISPSATSQSHSHTPTSSQYTSPAQTYRASPSTYPNTGSFLPQQINQAQGPSHIINEPVHQQPIHQQTIHQQTIHQQPLHQPPIHQHSIHQQPPPAQYPYNASSTWSQQPFRGQEQQFEETHDVSSYGYQDGNPYGSVQGMHDAHHSQLMHHAGSQHIGKLARPLSMTMS